MWNYILSGLRMFVFTPLMLVMAIIGILICIIQDLISFLSKQIWNQVAPKCKKSKTNQFRHLT